ncbi:MULTISPECIES: YhcN/YlaJ family sporulation lipoprotein [Oceanobacillus]|uniref:YhcN/YlaJ family sporulation lipoprotein n=2 Tax=Bacillaceae TaxID=186817 RepID=UPI0009842232|nr:MULTISPECIES: YhcN/YlaJ family sporulation lipoprotein [Oceanobacillus]
MRKMILRIAIMCLFILSACNQETGQNTQDLNNNPSIEQINTNSNITSQQPSNKAKKLLSQYEEVTEVHAVNTKHTLLVTVNIEHHERFTLAKKRKQYQKMLEQEFKGEHVEVSTDKKILIETRKIEKKIKENTITNHKINQEIDRIIHLAREQT